MFTANLASYRWLRTFAAPSPHEAVLAFMRQRVSAAFDIVEQRLASQRFIVGDRLTNRMCRTMARPEIGKIWPWRGTAVPVQDQLTASGPRGPYAVPVTRLRFLLPLCVGLVLSLGAHAAKPRHAKAPPPPQALGQRPALVAFADELAAAQNWDAAALREQLGQALDLPRVKQLILPAATGAAKNWTAYRDRFIEPKRLDAGVAFWAEHEAALARAESRYGVPAEVIVGIIGVETFYGRITGGFKVLDALATLAFDFPAEHPRAAERQAFFRNELAEFLKLCRENGLDAADVRGSYAGALGWPQFMPGSWRQHAVDFDGDGRVDLIASPVDAIGSVAHYLSEYGWQAGDTTHYSVRIPADPITRRRLLAPDIKPTFTAAQLVEAGAEPSEAARDHDGPLAVIELQNGPKKPTTVLLGTQNFWVVTRYNWSAYYALAVIELGQAVKARRLQTAPAAAQ